MKYLLMIYENEQRYAQGYDKMELAEYGKFGGEFRAQILGGHALKLSSTATSVRVREGKRLTTDGPFAETKEQLAGFYLLECRNLDEAIEWAKMIPTGCKGGEGCIEIRPISELPRRR